MPVQYLQTILNRFASFHSITLSLFFTFNGIALTGYLFSIANLRGTFIGSIDFLVDQAVRGLVVLLLGPPACLELKISLNSS